MKAVRSVTRRHLTLSFILIAAATASCSSNGTGLGEGSVNADRDGSPAAPFDAGGRSDAGANTPGVGLPPTIEPGSGDAARPVVDASRGTDMTAAGGRGGAGGGTAGRGGAGGAGGAGGRDGSAADAVAPAPPDGPAGACPNTLQGWATVGGDGVDSTTGGGSSAPVRPKTAEELVEWASDEVPRVIEIMGTFDVPRLQVASNKTLLGVGANATIKGGVRIRGKADTPVQNVILRNLHVDGATTDVDNDAVQIYFAHHVWIDHCEIWDGPDGNLDMTHAVNWITVSWTKFRYSAAYKRPDGEAADHRYSSLIGHSDGNAKEDEDRLKVSFHHNWWGEGVLERMPRVRFGQVHVFNNYFAAPGNNHCVRAGTGARLLVEGNHFDGVNNPHEFNSPKDETTASITVRNNLYTGTTGLEAKGGGGTPLTAVPYTVMVEDPAMVAPRVRACAGPH